VALETHCGLIVIGRHAKSGWARWLTGGAAESRVQGAPCSVLVVKEPLAGVQAVSQTSARRELQGQAREEVESR
jgi:hypothetical protein